MDALDRDELNWHRFAILLTSYARLSAASSAAAKGQKTGGELSIAHHGGEPSRIPPRQYVAGIISLSAVTGDPFPFVVRKSIATHIR
jgi:hypothetical protein